MTDTPIPTGAERGHGGLGAPRRRPGYGGRPGGDPGRSAPRRGVFTADHATAWEGRDGGDATPTNGTDDRLAARTVELVALTALVTGAAMPAERVARWRQSRTDGRGGGSDRRPTEAGAATMGPRPAQSEALMRPRFDIPAYDRALGALVGTVVTGMLRADSVMGDIPVRRTGHAGPTRNVPGPQPVDHPLSTVEHVLTTHADVIREGNVEAFVVALFDLAKAHEEASGRVLFQTLIDVTGAIGNSVDAGGQELSWDSILDAIEKVDLGFDDDGRPHRLTILASPKTERRLRGLTPTPAQARRHEEIVQRKREQWDAQKRTRRLPRRCQGA